MNQGWKRYNQNEIMTSNPTKLTIMAYEKCILNLNITKEKIQNFKYKEAGERIQNTKAIFNELFMQVNREAYPELADDLYRLYGWILEELEIIEMKKDIEKIDPVIRVVRDLIEGFKGALEGDNGK